MSNFSDIFGQDAAIETLVGAYSADRLPHGLIFAGPIGVGKGTTARALAEVFLCENPRPATKSSPPTPCGKCESCRGFAADLHPDLHVIFKELIRLYDKTGESKARDLSIHVIRPELNERAGRKSVLGRGKVFIIEEADLLSTAAQNAMLKTLEEPSGRTLIILLTDQPGALLPTVRSRCRLVPFAPLDTALIQRELQKRDIDPRTAANAARLSEGSLGLALRWIADGVIPNALKLIEQLESVPGGRPAPGLERLLKSAADGYAQAQLDRDELASKDQATRDGLVLYLRLAASYFRDRLSAPEQAGASCDRIDAIIRAENYLYSNVNVPLVLQQLALALHSPA